MANSPLSPRRRTSHIWQDIEVEKLVDYLYTQPDKQLVLLPGRNPPGKEGGKSTRTSYQRQVYRHIWPKHGDNHANAARIRTKIIGLHKIYKTEKAKMDRTGQGLTLDELHSNSSLRSQRERLLERYPWWEKWHLMMMDRPDVEPVSISTGGGYGLESEDDRESLSFSQSQATQGSQQDRPVGTHTFGGYVDDDSGSEQGNTNGRGLQTLGQTAEMSSQDPYRSRLHRTEPSSVGPSQEIEEEGEDEDMQQAERDREDSPSSKKGKGRSTAKSPHKRPRQESSARETMSNTIHNALDSSYKYQAEIEKEKTKQREMELQWKDKVQAREVEERRLEREAAAQHTDKLFDKLFALLEKRGQSSDSAQ